MAWSGVVEFPAVAAQEGIPQVGPARPDPEMQAGQVTEPHVEA
jgi:hypothetical protein